VEFTKFAVDGSCVFKAVFCPSVYALCPICEELGSIAMRAGTDKHRD